MTPRLHTLAVWLAAIAAVFFDVFSARAPVLGLLGLCVLAPVGIARRRAAKRRGDGQPFRVSATRAWIGASMAALPLSLALGSWSDQRALADARSLGSRLAAQRLGDGAFPPTLRDARGVSEAFELQGPEAVEVHGVRFSYLVQDGGARASLLFWRYGWLGRTKLDLVSGQASTFVE